MDIPPPLPSYMPRRAAEAPDLEKNSINPINLIYAFEDALTQDVSTKFLRGVLEERIVDLVDNIKRFNAFNLEDSKKMINKLQADATEAWEDNVLKSAPTASREARRNQLTKLDKINEVSELLINRLR